MARYYDCEDLISFVKRYTPNINGETTLECVERAIREAPTADVAPKSEVAREIFEEIEFDIHQLMFEREERRAIAIEGVIVELKKKYTGEQI